MMSKYGSIANMICAYPSKSDAHRMLEIVDQLDRFEDTLKAISCKVNEFYQ